MNTILRLITILLFLSGCTTLKNSPQESNFMKVQGGGYFLNTDKQMEETYGLVVNFKELPSNAEFLIADFELPNNPGTYERKVYPIEKKTIFNSIEIGSYIWY